MIWIFIYSLPIFCLGAIFLIANGCKSAELGCLWLVYPVAILGLIGLISFIIIIFGMGYKLANKIDEKLENGGKNKIILPGSNIVWIFLILTFVILFFVLLIKMY